MSTLVAARNLDVLHGGRHILKDVSLAVGERDFITVVGPNGAGKSTLLKCLMGSVFPDGGQIERKRGIKVGYMPQSLVVDYVMPITVRRFLSLRKQVDAAAVRRVAEETAAEQILLTPLHMLSGGELQRVLLARALIDEPDLLVLDEPAQNLDVVNQLKFYKLIERVYTERKISILMVSHDLHLVMSCTRQVVCLFHHICCSGEPQAVARDPEFVSLFGDDMARMMTVYHHFHSHSHDIERHAG